MQVRVHWAEFSLSLSLSSGTYDLWDLDCAFISLCFSVLYINRNSNTTCFKEMIRNIT